jgi:hypothetical protein
MWRAAHLGGTVGPLGGGGRVFYVTDKIWAQDKILMRIFAWLKYIAYHLATEMVLTYKQHILSPVKVRKVCYSLA